jgi:hypothetical protein
MRLAYTSMMVALCLGTSFATTANTISGQVKDENGNALKKGYVQIMGTNKRTSIDENGQSYSFQ